MESSKIVYLKMDFELIRQSFPKQKENDNKQ